MSNTTGLVIGITGFAMAAGDAAQSLWMSFAPAADPAYGAAPVAHFIMYGVAFILSHVMTRNA